MIQEFLIATDTEDALRLKRNKVKSVWYAGGTEINGSIPLWMQSVPSAWLSLDWIPSPMRFLPTHRQHGDIAAVGCIASRSPVAQGAALTCGSFTRRNMATIGGNLALMSDHSYLAPALLASRCRLLTPTSPRVVRTARTTSHQGVSYVSSSIQRYAPACRQPFQGSSVRRLQTVCNQCAESQCSACRIRSDLGQRAGHRPCTGVCSSARQRGATPQRCGECNRKR